MSKAEGDNYTGASSDGFRSATEAAVAVYEHQNGPPPPGKTVTLRVVEMYVVVENPIRDYRVVLTPGG